MSSHHIVREKQEPALLVLSLTDFPFELLGQLLEWSPTLIATTETAIQLHGNQIKVDWLIANDPIDDLQSDVKLIPVEDERYLETTLFHLIDQGYRAVNIITNDFNADKYLLYAEQIDLVIYANEEKIYPIKSGFSKWKQQGEEIKLITEPGQLTYTGLKQVSENILVTTEDGFFTIQFNQSYLFISELV